MQRKRKFSYNCRRNCPGGYEVDGEREGRGCLGAIAAVCGDPELLPGGDVPWRWQQARGPERAVGRRELEGELGRSMA